MAELNASTDSFIGLLLDVSGRARPADLQTMPAAEAADLLRAYAGRHPERVLSFDGDSLIAGAAPSASPAVVSAPSAPAPASFEFGPDDSAESPFGAPSAPAPIGVAAPDATGLPVAESAVQAPAWMFEGDAAGVAPAPGEAPAPVPAPADSPFGGQSDFVELPPLDGATDAAQVKQKVPLLWWIVAILFGLAGGLVGFIVLRKENPKGARNVLLTGLLAGLLVAVLSVAALLFGGFALLGLDPGMLGGML